MKNTILKNMVEYIFKQENKPLSVPNILKKLIKKGLSPNKTSLYRLLEKLKQEDQVEEILLNSKTTFYEQKKHHHHHFTCTECDDIQCLEAPEIEEEIHKFEKFLRKKGLSVDSHQFSLSGRCKVCILK